MCGIAGFVATQPGNGTAAVLERMTDAIRHRGPDDTGFFHDEWASLGHRRLRPIRQWLRDDTARSMLARLLDRNEFLASYLGLSEVEKLLARNQSGSIDVTDRIWRLLNLQLWGRLFLTGLREQPEQHGNSLLAPSRAAV